MTDLTSTIAERGARYGKFEDHAAIAQGLKDQMWATEGWSRLAPDQRQALEVIQDKVARILNGDPDYTDNWHDIAGYARLVEDRLNEHAAKAAAPLYARAVTELAGEMARPQTAGEQASPEPGWLTWAGGRRPVKRGALIDVRHRDGEHYYNVAAGEGASNYWGHDGDDGDIVAYRLSPKQD